MIVPLIFPMTLSMSVTDPVIKVYDFVEALPPDSVIWLGIDYYNSTRTECDPIAKTFLKQAFQKGHKIFVTSTIPDGQSIAQNIVPAIAQEFGREYGKDYVLLGYKPGTLIMMQQVCAHLPTIFNEDIFRTPIEELPMMAKVKNANDIHMVFTSTDNASFDEYVKVVSTQYHIPMAGGSTAVSVPKIYTFLNSGQIVGLIGGLKGAAEYETLIKQPADATAAMGSQSFVHILVVLMIIVSNIAYFMDKKRMYREEKAKKG